MSNYKNFFIIIFYMNKIIGLTAFLGGAYYFYNYIEKIIQSKNKLLLSDFDIINKIPFDIYKKYFV